VASEAFRRSQKDDGIRPTTRRILRTNKGKVKKSWMMLVINGWLLCGMEISSLCFIVVVLCLLNFVPLPTSTFFLLKCVSAAVEQARGARGTAVSTSRGELSRKLFQDDKAAFVNAFE
jgi:hypothetical protein